MEFRTQLGVSKPVPPHIYAHNYFYIFTWGINAYRHTWAWGYYYELPPIKGGVINVDKYYKSMW